MTSSKSSNPLDPRTKVITAMSIGAVALASLFAIGANLGILARADKSTVGKMSAAGNLLSTDTRVVDIGLGQQSGPLTPTSASVDGSQHFTVDTAGTVDVSVRSEGAHVDLVSPANGWTARTATASGVEVAVFFTNGARTLEFTAKAGPGGTVVGDLAESPTSATASDPLASDADHKSSHDSDHDHSHDHDGRDDDD